MKASRVLKSAITATVCTLAVVFVAGCSSAPSSSGSSSTSTASSAPATSSAPASTAQPSSAASTASQQASPFDGDRSQLTKDTAAAQGYQVFEGTVHVCTDEELIKLQGIDIDPKMVGGGGTYAVLVFDEPYEVTGMSADGSGERTQSAAVLGIAEHTDYGSFSVEYGDLGLCESLDGQHVTIAAQAQEIMFPSDVRLPLGEPSADTIIVLS